MGAGLALYGGEEMLGVGDDAFLPARFEETDDGRCSGELVPMAAILSDRELERLLAYLELPTELPKTAPARSPPFDFGEEGEPMSQINPLADLHDGIDAPAGELTPA